jgi:hypothetical protein
MRRRRVPERSRRDLLLWSTCKCHVLFAAVARRARLLPSSRRFMRHMHSIGYRMYDPVRTPSLPLSYFRLMEDVSPQRGVHRGTLAAVASCSGVYPVATHVLSIRRAASSVSRRSCCNLLLLLVCHCHAPIVHRATDHVCRSRTSPSRAARAPRPSRRITGRASRGGSCTPPCLGARGCRGALSRRRRGRDAR